MFFLILFLGIYSSCSCSTLFKFNHGNCTVFHHFQPNTPCHNRMFTLGNSSTSILCSAIYKSYNSVIAFLDSNSELLLRFCLLTGDFLNENTFTNNGGALVLHTIQITSLRPIATFFSIFPSFGKLKLLDSTVENLIHYRFPLFTGTELTIDRSSFTNITQLFSVKACAHPSERYSSASLSQVLSTTVQTTEDSFSFIGMRNSNSFVSFNSSYLSNFCPVTHEKQQIPSFITFNKDLFINCSSDSSGGALCITSHLQPYSGFLSIISSNFTNCSASYRGGCLCTSTDSTLNVFVRDCSFETGSAFVGGACFFSVSAFLTVSTSLFRGCTSHSIGGAICVELLSRHSRMPRFVSFTSCSFISNSAPAIQLPISLVPPVDRISFTDCISNDNNSIHSPSHVFVISSLTDINSNSSEQNDDHDESYPPEYIVLEVFLVLLTLAFLISIPFIPKCIRACKHHRRIRVYNSPANISTEEQEHNLSVLSSANNTSPAYLSAYSGN